MGRPEKINIFPDGMIYGSIFSKWPCHDEFVYSGGNSLISGCPPDYEMDSDLIQETLPQSHLSSEQERKILEILKQHEASE
jgi:hypothetical protein